MLRDPVPTVCPDGPMILSQGQGENSTMQNALSAGKLLAGPRDITRQKVISEALQGEVISRAINWILALCQESQKLFPRF